MKTSRMKLGVHFKSERQNWKTPRAFYQELNKEFNFDYDPCPNDESLVGFFKPWGMRNFCNPPYSKIKDWIEKGYHESLNGKLVVMLIPSRTDTNWWHKYAMQAQEIRFIKGRLKFDDYSQPAPFPSCLVIFKGE